MTKIKEMMFKWLMKDKEALDEAFGTKMRSYIYDQSKDIKAKMKMLEDRRRTYLNQIDFGNKVLRETEDPQRKRTSYAKISNAKKGLKELMIDESFQMGKEDAYREISEFLGL